MKRPHRHQHRRNPGVLYEETPNYVIEQEKFCKIQVQFLKKEENALLEKLQELMLSKKRWKKKAPLM